MASVQGFDPNHSGQHPVDDNGNPAPVGVWGDSDTGVGVFGTSGVPAGDGAARVFNAGVEGHSIDAPGVFGHGSSNVGVLAQSESSSGVLGVTFTPGVPGQEPDGHGVFGVSTVGGNGVVGFVGDATGVVGNSVRGDGVRGFSGSGSGVLGQSLGDPANGDTPIGVVGASDNGVGVRGESKTRDGVLGSSESGDGVVGSSSSGDGVVGSSDNGSGVRGASSQRDAVVGVTTGARSGLFGLNFSTEAGSGASGASVLGSGVEGLSFSRDRNVAGVVGSNARGFAGLFFGDVRINGSLSKAGGGFEIDHPLDPENQYLRHSFVESPDMLNVYNGNATTDSEGVATVELPDYFEALNGDFRYQLTVIGTFAQAIVAEEISDNRFTIKTDQPEVKVSWQVTGVRQDEWAAANRIAVEQVKDAQERAGRPSGMHERVTELLPEQLRTRVARQLAELAQGKPVDRDELESLIAEAGRPAERRPLEERALIDRAEFDSQWRRVEETVQRMRP